MSFIDTIQSKEVDIYISAFFTILGLILGAILDRVLKGDSPQSANQPGHSVNLTFNTVVNPPPGVNAASTSQDMTPVICMMMVIAGLIYVFFRAEILNLLSWITLFTISLWAGGTLHSLYRGFFAGSKWVVSLIFSMAFCVAATYLTDEAFTPTLAPQNFQYSQQIINEQGLTGIKKYFVLLDMHWFLLHLTGVMLFIYTSIRMMLFSTYFIVAGAHANNNGTHEPWLSRKTRKYANLRKNIIFMPILLVLAYLLTSGLAFDWFIHTMPNQVNALTNTVLYGR
ncbi:hypothetical protein E5170_00170 [Pseudomonas atacamensis]|uniref:Uncharacterized protein n=1 Tax=Pseudomonas atacamensis TaxID=2565368 RepID=A0AAQ2DET9_9PSED|nr:hypothetical protein [Pseudomonas atacamensis]QXH73818.1 hypothetical protein KSS92_04730 [Pseudomonas atacamensis]THF35896.1 hypothetical protein E5170_00170 [Pseudomonas atacamensis]